MNLYRLAKAQYAQDLAGTGGLYGPGRWHREGTRLLYTAEYTSLAVLEVLANSDLIPKNYSLLTLELPDEASVFRLTTNDLPSDWRATPAPPALADIAQAWLREARFWLLRVPSVHTPTEFNYLLNPLHPEHTTLSVASTEPYVFDSRLK